jgi:hypothetical protein
VWTALHRLFSSHLFCQSCPTGALYFCKKIVIYSMYCSCNAQNLVLNASLVIAKSAMQCRLQHFTFLKVYFVRCFSNCAISWNEFQASYDVRKLYFVDWKTPAVFGVRPTTSAGAPCDDRLFGKFQPILEVLRPCQITFPAEAGRRRFYDALCPTFFRRLGYTATEKNSLRGRPTTGHLHV